MQGFNDAPIRVSQRLTEDHPLHPHSKKPKLKVLTISKQEKINTSNNLNNNDLLLSK